MTKITMQQFEEFEKQFLFQVIVTPSYRFGQAFCNTFPDIISTMYSNGAIGERNSALLWSSKSRTEVLTLTDEYIIKG